MALRRTILPVLLLGASLASAQVAPPQRVRVSDGIMQGILLKRVNPIYPPLARQARIQGTVLLRAFINTSGDVENLELMSGHPMLAPAAIEAVKQWKYRPYTLNGTAVNIDTQIQVNFVLADKPAAEGDVGDAPGGALGGVIGSIRTTAPTVVTSDGSPQRVRVSSGVAQGLLQTKVNPQYPPDAKDQHVQGVVILQVRIDKEGNISTVQLISGHPLLAPAAIEAVKQWKYKPYLLAGNPVVVETQVTVNFTLQN